MVGAPAELVEARNKPDADADVALQRGFMKKAEAVKARAGKNNLRLPARVAWSAAFMRGPSRRSATPLIAQPALVAPAGEDPDATCNRAEAHPLRSIKRAADAHFSLLQN